MRLIGSEITDGAIARRSNLRHVAKPAGVRNKAIKMLVLTLYGAIAATSPACVHDGDIFSCAALGVPSVAAAGEDCCVTTHGSRDPHLNNCGGSRPVGLQFATRSPAMAGNGMAATSQPLSTMAAIDILKAGGNAVDAAIAANAMEGVVEPMMNGMGGDLMAIVYDSSKPKGKRLHGINSSGRSSKSTSIETMRDLIAANGKSSTEIPTKGPLPVSVPGTVMGWCELHDKFGKLPWSDLFSSAIRYASEGFPVTPVIAGDWGLTANDSTATSRGKFPHAVDGFYETYAVRDKTSGEYRAPRSGEWFQNPDLAHSLSLVASGGCEEFYNGSIAAKIAAFASIAGTRLTAEDMSTHTSQWVDPISTTYRERYEIFELPPNPQGLAALQQLNILENFNLSAMGFNSADYLHTHIEAKKLAFADRAKFYADPDFVSIPIDGLLSKSYAAQRAKLIDMTKAAHFVPAGVPTGHASDVGTANEHASKFTGDTIYLTTASKNQTTGDFMMVSLIQSNFEGFGSGLVVPGLGFALQDRGALFNMENTTADVYAAGKRPFHTIIPGFATKDGAPWLSFGVMGGNMQPQGHAQIISNMVDFGMGVQEAGDAARYYHTGSSQPTGSIMNDGGVASIEAGICSSVRDDLRSRGHTLMSAPNSGGHQAIELLSGALQGEPVIFAGASEMRKDGMAAGY